MCITYVERKCDAFGRSWKAMKVDRVEDDFGDQGGGGHDYGGVEKRVGRRVVMTCALTCAR